MKVIDVPATVEGAKIEVLQPEGRQVLVTRETVDFKKFLIHHCDNYSEGTKSIKQLRQLSKIVETIEASNGSISLEDAEYDLVKAACQTPKYFPGLSRQILSYFDAVESPQDVKAAKD